MSDPALVVCAHGTRNRAGAAVVDALVAEVADRRPALTVRAAYLDVQQPDLATVLTGLGDAPTVVVPLLLSAGFHVHVDIRREVGTTGRRALAAGALGPDQVLVALLAARLAEAGNDPADHVVLAAAGSSDARAVLDVERTATALAVTTGLPVSAGYLSAATPTVVDAVSAARAGGARTVAVATYLLAPGFFTDRLAEVGADLVAAPLLPDPAVVDLVLRRYDQTGG